MDLREFNGHTNWPTWCANLHLTNDESLYHEMRRFGRKGTALSSGRTREEFETFVTEMIVGTQRVDGSCGKDMRGWARQQGVSLTEAIGAIDWDALVESAWECAGFEPPRDVTADEVHPEPHTLAGLCRGCSEPVGAMHEDWCPLLEENEDEDAGSEMYAVARESKGGDGEHVHQWGAVEVSRFAGNPHRKCSCGAVSLDLDDDDETEEDAGREVYADSFRDTR
jgi:hypothetical protein